MTALQSVSPTRFFEEHIVATNWENRPMTPNLMHYLRYILCAFLVDIGMTESELDSSLWSPKTNLLTLQS